MEDLLTAIVFFFFVLLCLTFARHDTTTKRSRNGKSICEGAIRMDGWVVWVEEVAEVRGIMFWFCFAPGHVVDKVKYDMQGFVFRFVVFFFF